MRRRERTPALTPPRPADLLAHIPLAVVVSYSRPIERAIFPILIALQIIPKIAIAPLFIVWFGFGLMPKLLLVFLLSFFPILVSSIMLVFVVPQFEDVFKNFGAELPAFTQLIVAFSRFMVSWWWLMLIVVIGTIVAFVFGYKRSPGFQHFLDKVVLKIPVIGAIMHNSAVARFSRTLATTFKAGVPLVEALDSVGGASGNAVYALATEQIQKDVSTGSALTTSMQTTGVFPTMVIQMCAIGEESGALDQMLGKAAEFYEDEVDEAVKGLSSLMEPFIIVILGTLIGGIVVSMYLPIFKLGQVV